MIRLQNNVIGISDALLDQPGRVSEVGSQTNLYALNIDFEEASSIGFSFTTDATIDLAIDLDIDLDLNVEFSGPDAGEFEFNINTLVDQDGNIEDKFELDKIMPRLLQKRNIKE